MRRVKKAMGAICGSITAIGAVLCILSTELPMIPAYTAWQIVGLSLVCMGVWPMAAMCLWEVRR